jgi:hypothetical protein
MAIDFLHNVYGDGETIPYNDAVVEIGRNLVSFDEGKSVSVGANSAPARVEIWG